MTIALWKGPGARGAPYQGGDWNTGSNWSGGSVPGSDADVYLAAGTYSVSITDSYDSVASVSIGTGVELSVASSGSPPSANQVGAFLFVGDDSVNSGTLRLDASVALVGDGATLVNLGTITGSDFASVLENYTADGTGQVYNAGLITPDHDDAHPYLGITCATYNSSSGTIRAVGGDSDQGHTRDQMTIMASVTNDGTVLADGGLILTQADRQFDSGSSGSFTNLADGVLTGGTWIARAGGIIDIDSGGEPITTLAGGAVVELVEGGSRFEVGDIYSPTQIEASLTSIAQGSMLAVLAGRDADIGNALTVDGTFQLGGGTLSSDGDALQTIAQDGTLTGYGTIGARLLAEGTILATPDAGDPSGTLRFSEGVLLWGTLGGSGTAVVVGGTFSVKGGASLKVAGLTVDGGVLLFDGTGFGYHHHFTLAAGSVELGGGDLMLSGPVRLAGGEIDGAGGTLELDGRTTASAGTTVIDAAVAGKAAIAVTGGELDLLGDVSGKGGFMIGGGGMLDLAAAVAKTQTVTFDGRGGLELGDAGHFKAHIAGLTARDTIDLDGFASGGAKLSYRPDADGMGGTLRVKSGADKASLHLDGVFQSGGFQLADDGAGGSRISYAAPPAHEAGALHPVVADHFGPACLADPLPVLGSHVLA